MEPADQTHCEECGREIRRGYESVYYTESDDSTGRLLCIECYNQEMADYSGIDFQHPNCPPVELADLSRNFNEPFR